MHCSLPLGRAMHFLYMESPLNPPKGGSQAWRHCFFSPFGASEEAKRRQDLEGFSSLPEKNLFQTGEENTPWMGKP